MAVDITSWGQFKRDVVKELKDPEVKEAYKAIVIDTVDIASALCEKYICAQNGIENIGDGGWSVNGWKKVKTEFEETFRSIAQMGYALFFISHAKDKTFKREDGSEYNQIIPSLSNTYNEIVRNMSDLQGYAHQVSIENGSPVVMLTLRSMDGTVECKSRFKMIEPEIPFTYDALSSALHEAIDKEAATNGGAYVTNEPIKQIVAPVYDFNALMTEFNTIVSQVQEATGSSFGSDWAMRITEIVNKNLGRGKKVGDMTPDQAEVLDLIVSDLKDAVANGI
jgi:hypothetical protein